MCVMLMLVRYGKGKIIHDRGELAAELGIDYTELPVCTDSMGPDYKPTANECLCHVDFDAIARGQPFAIFNNALGTKWQCDVVLDDMLPEEDKPTKADLAYLEWRAHRDANSTSGVLLGRMGDG